MPCEVKLCDEGTKEILCVNLPVVRGSWASGFCATCHVWRSCSSAKGPGHPFKSPSVQFFRRPDAISHNAAISACEKADAWEQADLGGRNRRGVLGCK